MYETIFQAPPRAEPSAALHGSLLASHLSHGTVASSATRPVRPKTDLVGPTDGSTPLTAAINVHLILQKSCLTLTGTHCRSCAKDSPCHPGRTRREPSRETLETATSVTASLLVPLLLVARTSSFLDVPLHRHNGRLLLGNEMTFDMRWYPTPRCIPRGSARLGERAAARRYAFRLTE